MNFKFFEFFPENSNFNVCLIQNLRFMSRKTCSHCNEPVRRGDAIMKCSNCGTIFCAKCGRGFGANKCPVCKTKATKPDIIARG